MTSDDRLLSDLFPRSSRYHPDWVIRNGMGVLDLGCGRATSSIFLAREFGVQVWATDLWIGASENSLRIRDAGLEDRVFPLHADARSLPYAGEYFDAIVSLDSYPYYGTDAL